MKIRSVIRFTLWFYLGLSTRLEMNLQRGTVNVRFGDTEIRDWLRTQNGYTGMGDWHAERAAINAFRLDSANTGKVGRLFVDREVCSDCLRGSFAGGGRQGAILSGIRAAGLDRLNILTSLDAGPGRAPRFNNQWNPFLGSGYAGLVALPDRWYAISVNPDAWYR